MNRTKRTGLLRGMLWFALEVRRDVKRRELERELRELRAAKRAARRR